MAYSAKRKLADRILIEFIEADVDIGFGLVDEAKAYQASGQLEFSCRALREAANILADIERRIQQPYAITFQHQKRWEWETITTELPK